jgi:hypothetical protein
MLTNPQSFTREFAALAAAIVAASVCLAFAVGVGCAVGTLLLK